MQSGTVPSWTPSSLRKQRQIPLAQVLFCLFCLFVLCNDFSPDLWQQLYKRFVADSAPSVALHSQCENHNSPRVKWQEIIMANHVLWLYCLYWKNCTWLSVSPLGNAKLSHKAETNSTILVANLTSAGQLFLPPRPPPSGISTVLEHEKWVSQQFGCWIQNIQLQIASMILAHIDDINIWQMFCLHEMIYSYSSHAQVSNIRKK